MSKESTKEEAAAAPDASDKKEESASMHDLKNLLHNTKCESGGETKSLWQMTKETMGMADGGKSKSTDVLVETEDEALVAIKNMIQKAKEKDATKKHPRAGMWDFQWTPLEEFNASLDDVLLAFCRWTKKDNDSSEHSTMNITKAFDRLEHYAQWMYDARNDLQESLTVDSIRNASRVFAMKLTHDSTGRLLWFFDMPNSDLQAIKENKVTISESLRYFVWTTHVVFLDTSAQQHGMVFIQDMCHVGFWKLMGAFPGDLGAKMDRLTIGVLPIQMKGLYVLNADNWMKFLLNLMKAFMSKKLRQRIISLNDKNKQELVDQVGGPQYIPADCCGLEGTAETDIIFGTYITE